MNYRLTQKVGKFGCGCKLPKLELERLLDSVGLNSSENNRVLAGVGEDAGVIQISEDLAIIQHLDFFTPILNDPYVQGEIAACNAASDLFAKGCTDFLAAMMIIGVPEKMPDECLRRMVSGFKDFCSAMGAPIVGGQTIYSEWPIIGGSFTGVANPKKVVYNSNARPGDILVLTKPLGNRSTTAFFRESDKAKKIIERDIPGIRESTSKSIKFMKTSNRAASEVMVNVGVNSCTDVTGFGIAGHADNIAKRSGVRITIDTLPIFKGSLELSKRFGHDLEKGTSAETSGGLLISVSENKFNALSTELVDSDVPCFRIGKITPGSCAAAFSKSVRMVDV